MLVSILIVENHCNLLTSYKQSIIAEAGLNINYTTCIEIDVDSVTNNKLALKALNSKNYEILVLDIENPKSKIEAALRLKLIDKSRRQDIYRTIIIITSFCTDELYEYKQQNIIFDIVEKSVNDKYQLSNTIHKTIKIIEERNKNNFNSLTSEYISKSKKTILIVEDDQIVLELMYRLLEQAGYYIHVATNGLEAIDKLKEKKPDLILLDIMLPLLDGSKVIRRLKSDKLYKDIPIIVTTGWFSDTNEKNISLIGAMGANGFLSKPFTLEKLLDIIERHLL